ncbi:MAG: hypothetical protein A2289_07510 [Deltaproteobacteria bacterium RIFOXYA12_FULL_58_15]|nr:MAG: hypothetical protein A2289_07510 [Deltaproteobacteria bacterium RIFOXYA12_FULL_58_15]OGR10202.1 MAG: hypothetical protein A2341_06280 [Deltaproteobacteria bacterium RIFOXYB12_FULL_58_9]
MPIYEYECGKCGEVFEVFQKLSDPPPKTHTCGSRKIRRIMSQTSFILKGTGWYVTDYARKDKGGDDNGSAKSSKKDGESSDDKSKKDIPGKESTKKDSKKKDSGGAQQSAA